MVQSRSARFTLNIYHSISSVTSMLDELSWETLKSRRIKLQLTNLYKIQHNLIDVEASKYLTKRSTTVRSKHSSQLNLYQPSSDQFKFSFFPRTIIHWNSLPSLEYLPLPLHYSTIVQSTLGTRLQSTNLSV